MVRGDQASHGGVASTADRRGIPMGYGTTLSDLLQLLAAIFLLMVSLGIFFEPAPGYFATGVSVFMLASWISVLLSLDILLHGNPKVERRK